MFKKILMAAMILIMLISVLPARAANAGQPNVKLQFTGTTANCKGTVIANGSISVTLELWQGSTKLVSWPGSGSGYVQISQPYTVVSGVTYTLRLNGTINGVSFPEISETKTCP